jgi:hypothetical protein
MKRNTQQTEERQENFNEILVFILKKNQQQQKDSLLREREKNHTRTHGYYKIRKQTFPFPLCSFIQSWL